uniref:DDT domain-containing protein n=1 Tax=Panagrellus redivivus TaxID=6233 RepID=A0A7E4ZXF3_PANRE
MAPPNKTETAAKKRDLTSWLQGGSSSKTGKSSSDKPSSDDVEILSLSTDSTDTENKAPSSSMAPPAKKRKKDEEAVKPKKAAEAKKPKKAVEKPTEEAVKPKKAATASKAKKAVEQPQSDASSTKSPTKPQPKNKGQQSIFEFCKVQKPTPQSVEENKEKAAQYYAEALAGIRNRKILAYKQAIHSAKSLSEGSYADINSEFFKCVVFPNTAVKNKLVSHSEFIPNYTAWVELMTDGQVEDSFLTVPAIPDLKPVSEAGEQGELFGRCLAITEFVQTFSSFLDDARNYFSATDLMTALSNGLEGYYTVTSHLLSTFLTCFTTLEAISGLKCLNYRIDKFRWDHKCASEVVKIAFGMPSKLNPDAINDVLKDFLRILKKKDNKPQKKLAPLGKELAAKFEAVEFYQLEATDQMAIFEALMHQVMDTTSFNALFNEVAKVYPKDYLEKREKKLEEVEENMKKLRGSSDSKKKNSLYVQRSNLRLEIRTFKMHQRLEKAQKKIDYEAQSYLGSDRYHRKYHFFRRRSNFGIFVEAVPAGPNSAPCFVKGDKLASEIAKVAHITYAPTADSKFNQPQWFQITEIEEFDALIEGLSNRGVREKELQAKLKELRPDFINYHRCHNTFVKDKRGKEFGYLPEASDWSFVKDDLKEIVKKAEKRRFIHYSTNAEALGTVIEKIDSVESAALTASNLLTLILPCAFPPLTPGMPVFRFLCVVEWLKASRCLPEIHLILQLVLVEIRWDKLFSIQCPRCQTKFKELSKITACVNCFGFIHVKCSDPDTEPNGEKPLWTCESCNNKKTDEHKVEENDDEEEEEEEKTPEPLEDYIAGGRALRHTRARQQAHESSPTPTVSDAGDGTSRPRRAAANRRVVIDDTDSEEDAPYRKRGPKPKKVSIEKPVLSDVQARYDELKEDYRAFKSLQGVHFRGIINTGDCTVVTIGGALNEYKSVAELEKDIKALFAATKIHFAHNSRKLDDMKAYMEDFGMEIDDEERSESESEEEMEEEYDEDVESVHDEYVSDNDE